MAQDIEARESGSSAMVIGLVALVLVAAVAAFLFFNGSTPATVVNNPVPVPGNTTVVNPPAVSPPSNTTVVNPPAINVNPAPASPGSDAAGGGAPAGGGKTGG